MKLLAVTVFAVLLAAVVADFYDAKSGVTNLTPENFEEKVLKSSDIWLVEFYAPWCGHCKALTPEWQKAAKALKGSVKLGAVDADKHGSLGQKYGVEGFPTIKFFSADKTKPTEYEGGRKADDIVKTALAHAKKVALGRLGIKEEDAGKKKEEEKKQAPPPSAGFYEGSDVVELTDETFETGVLAPEGKGGWLVEFYAPWCGHCKSLTPEWKKAATALGGVIKVAAIDATAHRKYSEQYKVNGFPTIKFFPPGGAEPEDYNSGRTAEAIIAFGNAQGEKYPMAPLVVNQVENQAALDELCKDKTLCVTFVLPHVMDTTAAGRQKHIDTFASIASKLRARGVAFGWIVGGEHSKFEEGFGLFASYPTFIAFNTATKRYAVHKGTFNEAALVAGVKAILDGKARLSVASGELPQLSKGVALWDGKDYVPSDDE